MFNSKKLKKCVVCFGDNEFHHPNIGHINELNRISNKPVEATGGTLNNTDVGIDDSVLKLKRRIQINA